MRYDTIKQLSCEEFRRLTGVKPKTFGIMLGILQIAETEKHKLGGRPSKLSLEDKLLMCLEYLREYRTFFHISKSYDIAESNCWEIIRWVENTLIKDKKFHIPGKKQLLKSGVDFEIVLIDATESPCERPKKNSKSSILARKKGTQ